MCTKPTRFVVDTLRLKRIDRGLSIRKDFTLARILLKWVRMREELEESSELCTIKE